MAPRRNRHNPSPPAAAVAGGTGVVAGAEAGTPGTGASLAAWTAAVVLVILAGRVQPAGLPSPLAIPLAMAFLEMAPRLGWAAAGLGAAGAASAGSVYGAAVLLASTALARGLQRVVAGRAPGGLPAAQEDAGRRLWDGAAAGAVLLAGGLLAWPRTGLGWELDRLAGVAVTATLALLALPWMRQAAAFLIRALPGGEGLAGQAVTLRGVRAASARRALVMLGVLATGGLDGVRLLAVDAGLALRGLAILLAAEIGGAGWGAVAGAVAGLLGLLGGQAELWSVAWLALAGAAGGLMQGYGRSAVAAGFLLATAVVAGALPEATGVVALVSSGSAALAGYAAVSATGWPRRLAGKLPAVLAPGADAATSPLRAGRVGPAAARQPEAAPARAGVAPPASPWPGLLAELARVVEQGPVAAPDPRDQVGELVNDVARRHCLRCPHARTCWQEEFAATYQAMFRILADHERGAGWRPEAVSPALRTRCPRLPAIAGALAQGLEVLRVEMRWQRRLERTHRLVAAQLRGLAEVAARVDGTRGAPPARRPGWRYGMRIGVARTPKEGRWISGDGYLCRALDDGGRMVLAISDGMGSGRRAASESRSALQLLEKLLEAGLPAEAAVRLLNTALALRDREIYTTVDLAAVDLERGQVEFIKVGAAPSFVRRAREVQVIAHPALPAGYLEDGDPGTGRGTLQPGDLVVMVSDGVLTAFGDVEAGATWIRGYLAGLDDDEPRRVAAAIVKEALRRAGQRALDDMTVLAGKLLPRSQPAAAAGQGGAQ